MSKVVSSLREKDIKMVKVKEPALSVEDFIVEKVLPDFWEVVEAIRLYMRELAPDAKEIMSYGVPSYRRKRIIAVISPTKKDITLAFSRGAQFEDRYNRLRGVGNKSKHLKFRTVDQVEKEILEYYVRQALELDDQ